MKFRFSTNYITVALGAERAAQAGIYREESLLVYERSQADASVSEKVTSIRTDKHSKVEAISLPGWKQQSDFFSIRVDETQTHTYNEHTALKGVGKPSKKIQKRGRARKGKAEMEREGKEKQSSTQTKTVKRACGGQMRGTPTPK
ncbi:hypothetical protein ACTXT7_012003 [Hymenolepis weldensis]